MFDIGFSELMVIGVVALVVIGPERLPKVARTAGHLLGRLQRYVHDVKTDINREMQLDELKKLQSQMLESARTLESSVREEMETARSTFSAIGEAARPAPAESKLGTEPPTEPPTLAPASHEPGPQPVPVETSPLTSLPPKFDQTHPVA
ncbi:MAG: Sec-independent protein translocase protein TatB [Azovibrio sp.]|uniref:Sec-independent protein translocase protein TatB n=1 Tax=Azovibrio sp. TaxID=1872673 RepID=UPI003C7531B7